MLSELFTLLDVLKPQKKQSVLKKLNLDRVREVAITALFAGNSFVAPTGVQRDVSSKSG